MPSEGIVEFSRFIMKHDDAPLGAHHRWRTDVALGGRQQPNVPNMQKFDFESNE